MRWSFPSPASACETARSAGRPTNDLSAYDLYLRAYAMHRSSARQIPEALRLLEQAIARDPGYGPALAWAAVCCLRLVGDGRSKDPEADRLKGTDFARRALEVAGDDPGVLANAAEALAYFGEDIGAMMALVDRALVLNPNFARGWYISGVLRNWAGQPDIAIERAEASLRLSPRARVGNSLAVNRLCAFPQPALRRGSAEASPCDAGRSERPDPVSLSRRVLRPIGSARRRPRGRRAAAGHHLCRDDGRQPPAERRAPASFSCRACAWRRARRHDKHSTHPIVTERCGRCIQKKAQRNMSSEPRARTKSTELRNTDSLMRQRSQRHIGISSCIGISA